MVIDPDFLFFAANEFKVSYTGLNERMLNLWTVYRMVDYFKTDGHMMQVAKTFKDLELEDISKFEYEYLDLWRWADYNWIHKSPRKIQKRSRAASV